MIIYKTTNLINGKIYIGLDSKNNPNYLGSGTYINNAIKKYGKENFTKEILEYCSSKEELLEREIFWIKELNSQNKEIGYNITAGGQWGDSLTNHPDREDICRRISENAKERYKDKTKIPFYNKKHTEETRQKMRENHYDCSGENNPMFGIKLNGEKNGMFGKKHSEESIQKMRENNLPKKGEKNGMFGKHLSEESKQKMRETKRLNRLKKLETHEKPE